MTAITEAASSPFEPSNLQKKAEVAAADFLKKKVGTNSVLGTEELGPEVGGLLRSNSDGSRDYLPAVEKVKNELPFDTGLALLSTVFDSEELNLLLYDPTIIIEAVLTSLDRTVLEHHGPTEDELYKLVKFMRKFGQSQVKFGMPFNVDETKAKIERLVGGHQSMAQILLEKVVKDGLYKIYDARPFSSQQMRSMESVAERSYQWILDQGGSFDLTAGRKAIDPEVGTHFQAHGVLADGRLDSFDRVRSDLASLVYLLEFGPDPDRVLFTIQLRNTDENEAAVHSALGASGPYDTGGFIVLGAKDADTLTSVKAVIVNSHFYKVIPELKEAFPKVTFIRADKAAEEVAKLE